MSRGKYLSILNGTPVLYTGAVPSQGVDVSASKSLVLADANTYQNCINSSDITLTVMSDATTNFDLWTEIEITQNGTGGVIISADTGVTIRRGGSAIAIASAVIIGQYYAVSLKKVAANTWIIYGDMQ